MDWWVYIVVGDIVFISGLLLFFKGAGDKNKRYDAEPPEKEK